MNALLVSLFLIIPAALAAHVDLTSYPLERELREGYQLYWGFDVEAETIRFAVRVRTTGWVGLGLSPTGGMPNSDIVIGWVNDQGEAFLHDRFATTRGLPTVDAQQDWILEAGEEEGGYTVLAFRRAWVTCDDQDRDVEANTARVIFAWNDADPVNDDPEVVMYHGDVNRGAFSLNLIGAQQDPPPDPTDLRTFDIVVDTIQVPDRTTTYWCSAFELPENIRNQTHYITKATPVIDAANIANVHHFLIYECDSLNDTHVGFSAPCNIGGATGSEVSACRGGLLLAGWAVGGGTYYYPANVAYPVGGPGSSRYLVMETHYDNPTGRSDIVDSSGMSFGYTATPREFDSGTLFMGHGVSRTMIIPPGVEQYTIFGECSSECTEQLFPEGGINVFANTLHTHLAGRGLIVHHLRRTDSCNGEFEELAPIDVNLQYDFNFQEAVILPEVVNVQPGDLLRLECRYNTEDRDGVALGGESTEEEMCLTFLNYYPRVDLSACVTTIPPVSLNPAFLEPFLSVNAPNQRAAVLAAFGQGETAFGEALNTISWSADNVEALQSTVNNGVSVDLCIPKNRSQFSFVTRFSGLPETQCEYSNPRDEICGGAVTMGYNSLLMTPLVVMVTLFALL